jgi:hypothetical protein
MAKIEIEIDLEDLPYELADQLTDNAWLKFMKAMDEQRMDLRMTKLLREYLTEVIAEEEPDGTD